MFFIKIISKILKILHSNASPRSIALGIIIAFFIGFSPILSPQTLLIIIFITFINLNLGITLIFIPIFKLISLLFAKISNIIGGYLLIDAEILKVFWTKLYNTPIIPFTKFNNTVVLGNFIIILLLLVPLYFLSKKFIIYYRAVLMHKMEHYKIVKLFKNSKLYFIYKKLLHLVG